MSQTVSKKKQIFPKKIIFSQQIQNKENQVDHLMTETPLMELEKEKSHVTEHLKSPTLAEDSSKQEYCKIIDKSQSQSSELVSKKSYSSFGNVELLKKYSKRKSNFSLKNILMQMKVQIIRNNFLSKVKLNNIYSTPISQTDIWAIQNCQQQQYIDIRKRTLLKIWKLFYIIAILGIFFSLSFSIAFKQLRNYCLLTVMIILGIIATSVQIIDYLSKIMSILKRNSMRSFDAKPQLLLQTTSQFILFLNLLLIFSDYSFAFRQIAAICCLTKIGKLSSYSLLIRQKCINRLMLSKIFNFFILLIQNLIFAHLIAVILNYIIISDQSNWQVNKFIFDKQWSQRYIWSYYWAVVSIVKIGVQFPPANSVEAVWFIIVQILCFAILVYNISQITKILGFRKGQWDISRRANILQNMIDKQNFSNQLTYKIRQAINPDYIRYQEQSQQQNEILNELPIELQQQISIQKNQRLFGGIICFIRFSQVKEIASKMKKYRYYPQQIIRHYSDPHNIYILQNGTVSYTSKSRGWGRKMEANVITKHQEPFLLNWDFITMENITFNIKAKTISTVGKLAFQDFVSSLKEKCYDFEYYCFLRDKSKHILGQFETVFCRFCRNKHTAFTCHKMHYIPLKQNVIYRYLANLKKSKSNPRITIDRISMRKMETLKSLEAYRQHYNNHIRESYDSRNTMLNEFVKKQAYFYQNNEEDCYSKDLKITIKMLNQNVFPLFEKYEDNMWGLSIDVCKNYRNYFPKNNIINIRRNILCK